MQLSLNYLTISLLRSKGKNMYIFVDNVHVWFIFAIVENELIKYIDDTWIKVLYVNVSKKNIIVS